MKRTRWVVIAGLALLPSAPALAGDVRGSAPPARSDAAQAERRGRASTELCDKLVEGKTLTLTEDVGPCYDFGLRVEGARGLTIKLNGHRIFRQQTGDLGYKTIGIHVEDSSGVRIVGPGTVEGFSDNVRAERSSRVRIRGITARDSGDDNIQLINTRASVIEKSEAYDAGESGFSIMGEVGGEAVGNTIRNNFASGAGHALFQVAIQYSVNRDNVVKGNRGSGSDDAGIQVWGSSGNVIVDNEIGGVANSGIHVRNGSYHNLIARNTVTDAAIGIRMQAVGVDGDEWGASENRIVNNEVTGNDLDLQEGEATCVNTWRGNTFGSKNRDCIR